jgi:hypothetical protein
MVPWGDAMGCKMDVLFLTLDAILNDFRMMMDIGLVMRGNWFVA